MNSEEKETQLNITEKEKAQDLEEHKRKNDFECEIASLIHNETLNVAEIEIGSQVENSIQTQRETGKKSKRKREIVNDDMTKTENEGIEESNSQKENKNTTRDKKVKSKID